MSTLNLGNNLILDSDYSTSETPTGATWIDGKPIYKIVLQAGSISPNTSGSRIAFSAGLSGTFGDIVDVSGYFVGYGGSDNGVARGLFCSDMSTGLAFRSASMWTLSADKSTLSIYWYGSTSVTAFSQFTSGSITATILYTKTTD